MFAMAPLDPLIAAAASGFAAVVFARAALHKASDFTVFCGTLADYRLLPPMLVVPVAAVLLAGEVAIAVGLVVPAMRAAAALAGAGLLLLYGAAMASALAAGRSSIDCGCGGEGQTLSWSLVARNLVLAGIAGIGAAPVEARALGWFDGVTLPLAVLSLWLIFIAAEQLARTSAYIRNLRSDGGN